MADRRPALGCLLLAIVVWTDLAGIAVAQHSDNGPNGDVGLSQEERDWLAAHPRIRVAPDPNFAPIEFIDGSGRYRGMAAEFLALVEARLGVRFQIVALKDWPQVLDKARTREIDVLSCAAQTPQRRQFMAFTAPPIRLPGLILTSTKTSARLTLEDLEGMTVAVVSGYYWHELLKTSHPAIELMAVADVATGLQMTSFGTVDAMIGDPATTTYFMEKEGLTNLRVAGQSGYTYRLAMAVRSDWPELVSILDKALASITPQERATIQRHWIQLEQDARHGGTRVTTIAMVSVVVFLIALTAFLIWNRTPPRQDAQFKSAGDEWTDRSRNRRKILLYSIATMAFITLSVGSIADFFLYRTAFEQQRRNLVETVSAQARLIEAVARFDRVHSEKDHVDGAASATISQIVDAHDHQHGIGDTGEFALARLEDDKMVFLLDRRHVEPNQLKQIPFRGSTLAEPMRRALSGRSGTAIATDYRGVTVLAAYEPVAELGLGIAAKIDLSEIRRPFIRAAVVVLAAGALLVLAGGLFMVWINNPLIKRVQDREHRLHAVVSNVADAIITIDQHGTITSFNQAGETIFGYAASDVVGQNVTMLMGEPDHGHPDETIAEYLKTSAKNIIGIDREVVGQRKDGSTFPMDLAVNEMVQGGTLNFVGIVRDITERKRSEQELRKLNRAVEQSSSMVLITDIEGQIEYVNPKFTQVTGYSVPELIGQAPRILKSGKQPPQFYRKLWKTLIAGREWRGEFCNRKKDGTLFWASAAISPIRDVNGKTTHFVAIEDDITAQKEAAEEIKSKEERFRTLVANLPETIYRCLHDDAWTMKFISEDVQELTGYDASDFIENAVRTFDSVIHPDDRAMVADKVEQAVQAKTPWLIEYRLMHADGTTRWAGERGRAIFGPNGQVEYLDGVVADITQRVRMEEESQRINFLSDIALELTGCGYWHVDYSDPDYYYQSERAARILGERPKPDGRYHLQDEWFARLVEADPANAKKTAERYQGAIDGRYEHYESTYPYKRPIDGQIVWVHALGKVVRDDNGTIQYMYGVYQNITQRREMEGAVIVAREQAEAANRAKSDFLSNMSHELRTPLNGVLGYAQILQRDPAVTDRQRPSLNAIENCGQHLLVLINDVLDLAKIEAGRLEIDRAPCDLHRLLQSVFDIVRPRAEAAGLEIALDASPEVPRGVVTDATKLKQALVNLLGNAVKFTEKGSVDLHVRETKDHRLQFQIRDTGIGMTNQEMQEIFDPFKQAEGGKMSGGTGLGLPISKRIVEAMDGTLTVQSELGRGSRFTIAIPLVEAQDEDLAPLIDETSAGLSNPVLAPGQDITILVVDDRETNRDILVQLLENTGFNTVQAEDGQRALERLREKQMPLVFMDVRMPVMNGIDATQEIRRDPLLKHTVVIAVTASVFPDFQQKIGQAGCDDFIGKPFRANELFEKIEKHLKVQFVDQASPTTSQAVEGDTQTSTLPPELAAKTADRIRQAVKLGNVTALNTLASELEAQDGAASCGRKIGQLASAFDFAGLERMANQIEASIAT